MRHILFAYFAYASQLGYPGKSKNKNNYPLTFGSFFAWNSKLIENLTKINTSNLPGDFIFICLCIVYGN